jgi:hypothetical protein
LLSQVTQAVSPAPDGGYPGGNTAEGQNALLRLTSGFYNTAVGIYSLESNTTGNFNTAAGAGALFATTADENTGTGAGALFSNSSGEATAAHGVFALFNNTSGSNNTANGPEALFTNTTGKSNTATGRRHSSSTMAILTMRRHLLTQPSETVRFSPTPRAKPTAPSTQGHWSPTTPGVSILRLVMRRFLTTLMATIIQALGFLHSLTTLAALPTLP